MNSSSLACGKLPSSLLHEILNMDGPTPPEVLLPPRLGEDAGVIALANGALVLASDPVTMTGSNVGAHAVIVNANDVAVTGVRPRWFLATILLPEGTSEKEVRALYKDMQEMLDKHDILLVGGHSEVTSSVTQIIVSGHMLGYASDGVYIRTGDMHEGDTILQIGPAAVEAAAVIANELPNCQNLVSTLTWSSAQSALNNPGISVIEPARIAAILGAHAMHDPTEGGLSAGLHELASASQLAVHIDTANILWFEPGISLCKSLGADPWGSLASGALLAAFPPDLGSKACDALRKDGFDVAIIGHSKPGSGVYLSNGEQLKKYDRDEILRIMDDY